jgi:hypothetical protein
MADERNKKIEAASGFGLVLGAGLGLVLGPAMFEAPGIGLVAGAAIGLVLGGGLAAAMSMENKSNQESRE